MSSYCLGSYINNTRHLGEHERHNELSQIRAVEGNEAESLIMQFHMERQNRKVKSGSNEEDGFV